jgi:hypothetical protein
MTAKIISGYLNSLQRSFFDTTMSTFMTKVWANAIGFGIVWTGVVLFSVRPVSLNIDKGSNQKNSVSALKRSRTSSPKMIRNALHNLMNQ